MKQILLILLIVSVFQSCYKYDAGDTPQQQQQNNTTANDSVYLQKVWSVTKDTITNTTVDSSLTTYNYDGQKRLITVVTNDYLNVDTYIDYYFYNGNQQLPYKDSTHLINQNDVHYYFYNAANQLIKDSTKIANGATSANNYRLYTYSGNNRYTAQYYYPPNGPQILYFRDTALFNNNGSIINDRSWVYFGLLQPIQQYNNTTVYDGKKNPLINTCLSVLQNEKENPLSYNYFEYSGGGSTNTSGIAKHIYNVNNMPTSTIGTYNAEKTFVKFAYTKL